MRSGALGRVVASTSSKWKVGDLVTGYMGWSEFAVLGESAVQAVPEGLSSPTLALSILGGTGLTAWHGLNQVGHVKPEHTVIISGAAGATGSTAIQLAKNVVGCKRVVGIAGGKDKCDYVVSLGADACVDYKVCWRFRGRGAGCWVLTFPRASQSPTFEQDLINATPDYADLYFDK